MRNFVHKYFFRQPSKNYFLFFFSKIDRRIFLVTWFYRENVKNCSSRVKLTEHNFFSEASGKNFFGNPPTKFLLWHAPIWFMVDPKQIHLGEATKLLFYAQITYFKLQLWPWASLLYIHRFTHQKGVHQYRYSLSSMCTPILFFFLACTSVMLIAYATLSDICDAYTKWTDLQSAGLPEPSRHTRLITGLIGYTRLIIG